MAVPASRARARRGPKHSVLSAGVESDFPNASPLSENRADAESTDANDPAAAVHSMPAKEADAPMLDVHPVHGAPRSWREFLVQIATISTGLLMAIGLEQSVEYVHRRHQLQEARREIDAEMLENQEVLKRNTALSQKLAAELDANMALLRATQPPAPLQSSGLKYGSFHEAGFYWPHDGPWQIARQNGSLSLMPHGELQSYVYAHEVIAALMQALTDLATQMNVTAAIAGRSLHGPLSPADIQELVSATSAEQGKLALLRELLEFEVVGLRPVDH
jgi:hypothetical protein